MPPRAIGDRAVPTARPSRRAVPVTDPAGAGVIDDGRTIRLGPLDELIGYHLRRTSALVSTDFAGVMSGTGVRQVLFGILSVIAATPGINQSNVGRALGIQRANMVSLVNELLDGGLILREVAPDDRRAFTFALTAAGRKTLDDALTRIRAHEDRLLAGLSAGERATLRDLLRRIEPTAGRP